MLSYLIAFLQGILTFVSPCILPLVPVFIFYLAGNKKPGEIKSGLLIRVIAFVLGFSIVFSLLGATATVIGTFFNNNISIFRKISGSIMILIGLNFLGIVKIRFLNKSKDQNISEKNVNIVQSLIFGITFAFAWSPCLTAFLGNILVLASNQDTLLKGSSLLLTFSIGLGLPFILTSILYEKIVGAFTFIKKN